MAVDNVYSDIDMELTKQADGYITRDTDVQAIFNSIENIVMTIQGSRRMRPDFALGPHNFLFEQITEANAQQLGNVIGSAIALYENRINVVNIHVEYNLYDNLYKVTINFTILGRTYVIESIDFTLKRL